jgi:copper chaperone
MKFLVSDMTCGHCASHIRQAITAVDSAADVQVDLDGKLVTVASTASSQALADAISAEGYTPALQTD